jgi:hypothetical protein
MTPTIASPLCIYGADCPKHGRAVLGPKRVFKDCINRSITCQNCGATGEESIGTEAVSQKSYRDLKLNKRRKR